MPKQVIIPANSVPPLAPYSAGTRADGIIYVSGCLALDSAGKSVGTGDVRSQTKVVLDTIKSIVEAGGGTLADITFNTIFLKDLADYAAMNEVFGLPEIRARLATMSMQPAGGSPADMAAFLKAETARWGEVIRAANITVN